MVKKLLILAAAAAGAFAIWRKIANDKAEQDLWNEAVADLDSDAPVVDLMEALKKSVAASKSSEDDGAKPAKKAAPRKRAAARK